MIGNVYPCQFCIFEKKGLYLLPFRKAQTLYGPQRRPADAKGGLPGVAQSEARTSRRKCVIWVHIYLPTTTKTLLLSRFPVICARMTRLGEGIGRDLKIELKVTIAK